MHIIRTICLFIAWLGLAVVFFGHFFLVAFTKGMGSNTLSLENVLDLQVFFAVLALPIMGLFWAGGWRLWRGICLTLGAQALMFGWVIFSLRYDHTVLEMTMATTALIAGAAAILAACVGKAVLRQPTAREQ